ncbi:MAG: hypothetical protein AAGC60_00500 [Acidobacteriota bacterium]
MSTGLISRPPTCTIVVDLHPHVDGPGATFFYTCASCSPTWHVAADGTIAVPSRRRALELRVADPSTQAFSGVYLVHDHVNLGTDPGIHDHTKRFVATMSAAGDSMHLVDIATGELESPLHIFYSLGLTRDGRTYWDDPKIYHLPDQ